MSELPVIDFSPGRELLEACAGPSPVTGSVTSLRTVVHSLRFHWQLAVCLLGGTLLACLVYCLVIPREYEAKAQIALRIAPVTGLNLEGTDGGYSGSFASGQTQLETLANVFRSDRLAWRVIVETRLYRDPAFAHGIMQVSGFRPDAPAPEVRAKL